MQRFTQLDCLAVGPAVSDNMSRDYADFSASALDVLNHIRVAALECRCSARTEIQKACNILSTDPVASHTVYARVLVQFLAQVLRRSVTFFSPGVSHISNDEAWLLRLIVCLRD